MTVALKRTVDRLRRLASLPALEERTDRQLLDGFARTSDEAAFTLLVRRHGSLVLGVCRRVLGNADDADDAFQATFLVLARKAGTVAWHDSVRNWLHGVAYRIARKARTLRARQLQKERRASIAVEPSRLESAWAELRGVLDEELERLPERYRAPLLLCCLEGKSREETAHELGWSVGSVKGRLERGRELLRKGLQRRGLTLSAVLWAGTLAESSVSAALAEAATRAALPFAAGNLAGATTSTAAIHLAQGALQAMLIAKCKITGFALTLVAALGVGGSLTVHYAQAERPASSTSTVAAGELPFTMPDFTQVAFQDEQERRREERKVEPKVERKDAPKEERRDGPKEPRREERKDERGFRGILRKIDVKVGSVTIQSLRDGEQRVEHTLNLAGKDVKVTTPLERPFTLADLREGLTVTLVVNDAKDVTAIRADLPTLKGVLHAVDADKKTITVRVGRSDDATFKVAADARVHQQGRPAQLKDLGTAQAVALILSLDKETALTIEAGRPELREAPREVPRRVEAAGRDGRLGGVITDVDAGKNTISLLVGRENDLTIKTLTLGKDAKLRLLHPQGPLQDLTIAQLGKAVQAWVTLGDDKTTVTGIDIMAPIVRQRLKTVDAAGRKLTVEAEGKETAFEVAPDAKVIRGRGEAAGLAELTPGMIVMLALSPDRSRVLAVTVVPTERDER